MFSDEWLGQMVSGKTWGIGFIWAVLLPEQSPAQADPPCLL
jgi:hypothetical protein